MQYLISQGNLASCGGNAGCLALWLWRRNGSYHGDKDTDKDDEDGSVQGKLEAVVRTEMTLG